VFYRTIWHQQPMLKVKVTSALPRALEDALKKDYILGVDSLQNQFGCGLGSGRVPVDPSRFVGPKYLFATPFHADTAGVAESLCICQMGFAAPEFDLGVLPGGDINYRANDLDALAVIPLSLADNMKIFDSSVRHQ
jgi:hypothetical protein